MKKKPDIILVLAVLFTLGALVSNYTFGTVEPEQAASHIIIR